jgi:diaminopimelate decarboxylase
MTSPVRRLDDWDADGLRSVAAEFGTPLYALDLERVRENCRRMTAAFPDAEVLFAAKANTLGRVLETVWGEGVGVECASAGELRRALDAGVPGEELQYTAVNPPDRDLDIAVEAAAEHPGITITAGARDTVERLRERGYAGRLCVRVNPGVGAGHHEKVSTGADAKFGVPYDDAAEVLADAATEFDVVGIHAHAGSGISGDDLESHRELVSRMGALARASPVPLEFVDVGGGFGVPYRPEEPPLDLEAVAEATREALGPIEATLAVEPGRYLVADAGVLLTEVNTVKPTVIGTDAGMTDLIRPAMYDAYHEIRTLAPGAGEREARTVTVTGPVCESGDVLARERTLPDPARGDLLAVGNAGAYGYEMASNYNTRPRPATVTRDAGGDWELARRRETVADITDIEA